MNRRNFTQLAGMSGLGLLTTPSTLKANTVHAPYRFNLNYAPHLGMFRHHAGNDPIDQLNFMADQGFIAFEDSPRLQSNPILLLGVLSIISFTLERNRSLAISVL